MNSSASAAATEELSCDLCILGAGIAGLNALVAATSYLSRNQKVVLVDRRTGAGGMWRTAYDYVRLHQPHPMFTAGDIAWTSGLDPSYLASRSEVVAHLTHCLETVSKRANIDARFGYEYQSHDESAAGPDEVLVHCVNASEGRPTLRIKAKKLIKAFGFDVKTKPPLALSSKAVRSLSPDEHDLLGEDMRSSKAPVYVVGGGKTGMDTAYALITNFPDKPVKLLIGHGTMFGCRDKLYPKGMRRYFSGSLPVAAFLDLARRFDGRNELEVLAHFRATYAVSIVPDAKRFMLGLLSEHENAVIAKGSNEIVKDYLVDVVDQNGRPTLLLKSGAAREVEPGSTFINCTGYAFKQDVVYEPFVSKSGKVVSIQAASAIQALSTASAYLGTHLSYVDQLQKLPLYELDLVGLNRASPDVLSATIGSHTLYNAALMINVLPKPALDGFGADLARWFPAPRRMLDGLRFLRYMKQNPDQIRRSLDTVRERFGIRCGPLQHA